MLRTIPAMVPIFLILNTCLMVTEDDLASLKHYADEVEEVRAGTECGLSLKSFTDIKEGDVLECFIINEVIKKL